MLSTFVRSGNSPFSEMTRLQILTQWPESALFSALNFHPGNCFKSCLLNSCSFVVWLHLKMRPVLSMFWEGKLPSVSVWDIVAMLTVGIKWDRVMKMGPQICHGNIWPSGALGGLIVIQQQLEAARLEWSHTPRGAILMWAPGPWDQYNCICMVVSGCPHLSGFGGGGH